jgi:hypothetical protein
MRTTGSRGEPDQRALIARCSRLGPKPSRRFTSPPLADINHMPRSSCPGNSPEASPAHWKAHAHTHFSVWNTESKLQRSTGRGATGDATNTRGKGHEGRLGCFLYDFPLGLEAPSKGPNRLPA